MPATLSARDLVALAQRVGFTLTETGDPNAARIYVYTDPTDNVVYIGKADSLTRHSNEATWVNGGPVHTSDELVSGFVYMVQRNNATPRYYQVKPADNGDPDSVGFDAAQVTTLMEQNGWKARPGNYIEDPAAVGAGWRTADLESLLIRICVRVGVPIANASSTGLWAEGVYGKAPDLLAALLSDDIAACLQGPGPTDIAPARGAQQAALDATEDAVNATALDEPEQPR
ncbi:hypothetical protein HJ588_16155 [Flexivirga sp. ID2601S]|uniref:Uncharacterized protein n=1 Tax=Flexivirga aerilata TaxID=1656889 RepID=A0A849AMS6_9MICO|nr:hypothetical protein [Flexivirga aerilata]NNG40796.1 hypothetical protein [Flexivirga aerilata]